MKFDSDPNYRGAASFADCAYVRQGLTHGNPTHARLAVPPMTVPPTPLRLASTPAPDEMYALVYDELKRIARHHLRSAGAKATLSTTELVHEAFLKLHRGPESGWEGRRRGWWRWSRTASWSLA